MRSPIARSAEEFVTEQVPYDSIIDVRSPSEFALDHIPGAINLPVLSDEQRAQVGTINAEQGSFEANRLGAALISERIANILQTTLADKPRQWRSLVYCWRGGQRSGSLATVMARVGWRTELLDGGYKAWRRAMTSAMTSRIGELSFLVMAGRTGSGKSHVLSSLMNRGQQVLDLEGLANHRGSVLGLAPGDEQPSQKMFESRLWSQLSRFTPAQPIWVESESRKIGRVQVPDPLIRKMRESACVTVALTREQRTALLIRDYPHFIGNPESLKERLGALASHHGKSRLEKWFELIDTQRWNEFVTAMLAEHYDPSYDRSMRRNFLAERPAIANLQADGERDVDAIISSISLQAYAIGRRVSGGAIDDLSRPNE